MTGAPEPAPVPVPETAPVPEAAPAPVPPPTAVTVPPVRAPEKAPEKKVEAPPEIGPYYADLGHFPTNAMAQAHVAQVEAVFEADLGGLTVANIPEVKSVGGTPDFLVHVTGFTRGHKARDFCAKLRKKGIACKAKPGNG